VINTVMKTQCEIHGEGDTVRDTVGDGCVT
jgi:hypothetical protein